MKDYPTPTTKPPSYMQIVVDFNKWLIVNDYKLSHSTAHYATSTIRTEWKRLVNVYLEYMLDKFDRELGPYPYPETEE